MTRDRYEIVERLAVGGMGEVFLARQRGQGKFARVVVLKQLLPDALDDGEPAERLLDEARLAAAVSHDNVVTVLEVGEREQRPFLALEYVHGLAASLVLRRAQRRGELLPVGAVARIVQDAARGLHAAHSAVDEAGRPLVIVHRDVAPKNILVRVDGIAKIVDFGVADAVGKLARTATGAIPGTLCFMAPEQARAGDCSALSDQFSLGVTLWEMLTSERLFRADLPTETLQRLFTLAIPSPRDVRADVDAGVAEVCDRMLQRDPADRFASLADVVKALERALPGLSGDYGRTLVASTVQRLGGDELAARLVRIEEHARAAGLVAALRAEGGRVDSDATDIENRLTHLEERSAAPAGDDQSADETGADAVGDRITPATRAGSAASVVVRAGSERVVEQTIRERRRAPSTWQPPALDEPRVPLWRRPAALGAAALVLWLITVGLIGAGPVRTRLVAATAAAAAPTTSSPTATALDHEALTRAHLTKERVEAPLIFAAETARAAEERGIAVGDVDVVVEKLQELVQRRLELEQAHWQQDASTRERERAHHAVRVGAIDAQARKAVAHWPTDLRRFTLEELRAYGAAPDEWLVTSTGATDSSGFALAVEHARVEGPADVAGAIRRLARRLARHDATLDDDVVMQALLPPLGPLLVRRLDARNDEAAAAAVDREARAHIDRVLRGRGARADELADDAFVLWQSRADLGRPDEPVPGYGPSLDVVDAPAPITASSVASLPAAVAVN